METNLAVVKTEDLDVLVKNSGLEITEGENVKQSYQPFLVQLAEIHEQATKIAWEKPTELDESIARNLRLKTVKIRTGASELKDQRKRTYLLRGNLEQAAYNLIAATCKVAEDAFTNVEKAREIAEAKRIEVLRIERTAQLLQYDWVDSGVMNVGKLDEPTYLAMLAGLKKAQEDRIAEAKRIEEERIAKEKAEAEERERIRLENERLRKEAEEKEAQLKAELEKAEKERKEAEDKARKEREAIEAKAKAEREKAAKEAAEKLEAERKERSKIEAELQAKKQAEEAARVQLEKEEAARIAAEKKAAAAPDKEKLLSFASKILIPAVGELKTPEAQAIYKQAAQYLTNVVKYVQVEAGKL